MRECTRGWTNFYYNYIAYCRPLLSLIHLIIITVYSRPRPGPRLLTMHQAFVFSFFRIFGTFWRYTLSWMGDDVCECVCTMHIASSILATVRAHNYNQRVQRLWALFKWLARYMMAKYTRDTETWIKCANTNIKLPIVNLYAYSFQIWAHFQ